MVKILDCTTRDGGHTTNWNFEKNFIHDLIKCQNNSNISYYEIGYRNHFDNENKGTFYNCNPNILKEFYDIKENILLGVMTDTKRFSIQDFHSKDEDNIDFIRIACHPDRIKETLDIAKELYSRGYKIFVQLMDISNVGDEEYKILEKWNDKNILESLYCADSYGTITPQDVEKYFNRLKEIGFNKISFHAHNNSNLALANSLKAVEKGAFSIDITLNGIGRCGGNLNAEEALNTLDNFNSKYYKELRLKYPKFSN